jgi:hypothetical protein
MANLEWHVGAPVACIVDPAENIVAVMMAIDHGYELPKVGQKYIIAEISPCIGCFSIGLREIAHPAKPTFCKNFFRLLEHEGMKMLRKLETPIDGDPKAPDPVAPKIPETVDG